MTNRSRAYLIAPRRSKAHRWLIASLFAVAATPALADECKPRVQTPEQIEFCSKTINKFKPQCLQKKPLHPIEQYDERFQVNMCRWKLKAREIYFGRPAAKSEYRATVLLTKSRPPIQPQTREEVCSGTLISRKLVLTAGHCIGPVAKKGSFASFGTTHREAETIIEVDNVLKSNAADIALVLLKTPAPESMAVATIAPSGTIAKAPGVRIAGFGYTELRETPGAPSTPNLELIGQKRFADVVVASPNCAGKIKAPLPSDNTLKDRSDAEYYDCKKGITFTAANIDRSDTCTGDSGGPALVASQENQIPWETFDAAMKESEYFLAGVTSKGLADNCGPGGIYTLLEGDTLTWIQESAEALGQTVKVANP